MCACGQGDHTVHHLIYDCSRLEEAREALPLLMTVRSRGCVTRDVVRPLKSLLHEYSYTVSTWAIDNFELAQYEWTAKQLLYGSSK